MCHATAECAPCLQVDAPPSRSARCTAGDFSIEGLLSLINGASQDKIYTTVIGLGLDFNTDLVESITKVKGANYFSVHTPGEFRTRCARAAALWGSRRNPTPRTELPSIGPFARASALCPC